MEPFDRSARRLSNLDRIIRMATNGGQIGTFDSFATVVDPLGITSGPGADVGVSCEHQVGIP